jgi:hypothetical protein
VFSGGGVVQAVAVNATATKVILTAAAPFGAVALPPTVIVVDVASGASSGASLGFGQNPIGIAPDPTNPSVAYVLVQPPEGRYQILRVDVAAEPPTIMALPPRAEFDPVSQARTIAISPDGRTLFVGGSEDFPVAAISAVSVTGTAVTSWIPPVPVGEFTDLVVAPDGTALYGSAERPGDPSLLAVGLAGGLSPASPELWEADRSSANALQITDARCVTVSPSGGAVFVGGTQDTGGSLRSGVQAYRASNGDVLASSSVPLVHSVDASGSPVGGLASLGVSPEGGTVLAAGETLTPSGAFSPLVYPLDARTLSVGGGQGLTPGFTVASPQGITMTPDQAPVAVLAPSSASAGAPVTLDATGSSVRYGSISRYQWAFGDGTLATTVSPTVSHIYAAAGNYIARVTETDSAGTGVPPAPATGGNFAVDGPGQTAFRSASTSASTSAPVAVSAKGVPPPPPPTTSAVTSTPPTTVRTPIAPTTTSTTTARGNHRNPTLTLSPTIGTPGTIVTVTGRGFAHDSAITVRWSISEGSVVMTSDGHGNLGPGQLLILTPDVLGPRHAQAVGTGATAPFLVVADSTEPGGDGGSYMFRSEGP